MDIPRDLYDVSKGHVVCNSVEGINPCNYRPETTITDDYQLLRKMHIMMLDQRVPIDMDGNFRLWGYKCCRCGSKNNTFGGLLWHLLDCTDQSDYMSVLCPCGFLYGCIFELWLHHEMYHVAGSKILMLP